MFCGGTVKLSSGWTHASIAVHFWLNSSYKLYQFISVPYPYLPWPRLSLLVLHSWRALASSMCWEGAQRWHVTWLKHPLWKWGNFWPNIHLRLLKFFPPKEDMAQTSNHKHIGIDVTFIMVWWDRQRWNIQSLSKIENNVMAGDVLSDWGPLKKLQDYPGDSTRIWLDDSDFLLSKRYIQKRALLKLGNGVPGKTIHKTKIKIRWHDLKR